MNKILILSLAVLVAVVQSSRSKTHQSSAVVEVTDANIQGYISNNNYFLLDYYTSWW